MTDSINFRRNFFPAKLEVKLSSSQLYELAYTCPHVPFPGYVGLVKLYKSGVTVKNVQIEKIDLPFEEEA